MIVLRNVSAVSGVGFLTDLFMDCELHCRIQISVMMYSDEHI